MRAIAFLPAMCVFFCGVTCARADVIVSAGYSGDNPLISIFNNTGTNFTDVQIVATNPSGSVDLGPLSAGNTLNYSFNGSGPFQFDPDDFGGGASNNTNYSVVLTLPGGSTVSTPSFSPNTNSSGHPVDFLGFISDNDFSPIVVASAPLPEPTSFAVFGFLAAAGAVYGWRRRQASAV